MSADKAGANVPHFSISQLLSIVRYIQLPVTGLMIQYESFVGYDERGSPRLWEKEEESSFLERGREDRFWDVVIENRRKKHTSLWQNVALHCSLLVSFNLRRNFEMGFAKRLTNGLCFYKIYAVVDKFFISSDKMKQISGCNKPNPA